MHGDQVIVDQTDLLEPRERTHAVIAQAVLDFLRGLVQVDVHRQVELVGQQVDALEALVGDRVRRVRREGRADQCVAREFVVDGERLVEILVAASSPRRSETR